MKKVLFGITLLVGLFVGGAALAQTVPDLENQPLSFFVTVYEALKSGQWMMVFGGVLIAVVFVVRKILSQFISWFKTRLGGYVVSFGTAALMTLGTALLAGGAVSLQLMMAAVSAAFVANGGWEALKDVLSHLLGSEEEEDNA